MMWIMLGYLIASMAGGIHSPFQGPEIIQNTKAAFDDVIEEPHRKKKILRFMKQLEKDLKKDNKRLFKPLKNANKRIGKGKIERESLESLYHEFSEGHVESIKKNTRTFLTLKTKVSKEEWEEAFEKIMSKSY